jgi:hypothetical protein
MFRCAQTPLHTPSLVSIGSGIHKSHGDMHTKGEKDYFKSLILPFMKKNLV